MVRSGSRKGTSVKPTGENDKNKKIEELKQEFAERAMQIPEEPKPHRYLDGGGGPFHDLGVEFQKRLRQIVEEQSSEETTN